MKPTCKADHLSTRYSPWHVAASSLLLLCSLILLVPTAYARDAGIESLKNTGRAFASVAKQVSPAVVFIQVTQEVKPRVFGRSGGKDVPLGDELLRRFFGMPNQPQQQSPWPNQPPQERQGQGSGFIISEDGYILTNNHVVGDADRITVKLLDGRTFTAEPIGTDPGSDVAIIKIDATDLPVLPLGDSEALEVGEWVLAVGNPFGLSHTLTAGIVSAKGRSGVGLSDYEDFIQTDAAINPGNSGGPLVDLDGRVIGMNTAIFSRSGGSMGIGFAIPINMVKAIRDQLLSSGHVIRGFLGIVIQDLTPELAKTFDMDEEEGVLVAQVTPGSPADEAGLKQGDVIVSFDGKQVRKVGAFRNRVSLTAPETRSRMKIIRRGKSKTLTVRIGTLPDDGQLASARNQHMDQLGMTLQALTPELARQFDLQIESGVVVTQVTPGSVSARAGIRAGTVIREVNRHEVSTPEAFRQAMEKGKQRGTVLLLVIDGAFARYVTLTVE